MYVSDVLVFNEPLICTIILRFHDGEITVFFVQWLNMVCRNEKTKIMRIFTVRRL